MFAKRAHTAHDFELNLTPVIDCFVTLICFLLLSATYVNLVGMEAKVPVVVPVSSPQTPKEPPFKAELTMKKGGFELVASGAGTASGKRFIGFKNEEEFKTALVQLHGELVKVKQAKPKEFSLHFQSQVELPFEQLVQIMDASRNLGPKDPTFQITDERNGKAVVIDVLFPDFVFANLGAKATK